MKDDLRYTPSDCFETVPFPENWEAQPALEATGKDHPDERDPDILKLRELYAAMDRAVLDAYGWISTWRTR